VLFSHSVVNDSATPWTVACQGPLFMRFSRQEHWSGLPFPSPGDLPDSGIKPASLTSPALAGRFITTEPPGKPICYLSIIYPPSTYHLCDYRSIRPSLSDALGHLERIHGAVQTVKSSVKSTAGPACPAEQTTPSLFISSCDSLRVDVLLPHKSPDSSGATVRLTLLTPLAGTHTRIHTYKHTLTLAYTHACTHSHTHTHIHTLTYTHTRIHTYKHTLTHTCMYTFTHTHIHTCTHSHTRTHMHTYTLSHTHIHTFTHTNTLTLAYTHVCIHTCAHTCTLTNTHVHIHTYKHTLSHSHTYMYAFTHTNTHSYTHTRMYVFTHTHMHTYTLSHPSCLTPCCKLQTQH